METNNILIGSPVFKCANFEKIIRNILNKSTDEITAEDMSAIEILDVPSKAKFNIRYKQDFDLTDISGIEYCCNLTFLDIRFNNVSDISGLSGLTKLKTLKINGIKVDDFSPLSRLINLEYLDINNTNISDINVLSGLKKLNVLWMSGTQVSNLEPLRNLVNLKELNILNMPLVIESLNPLTGLLNLTSLWIGTRRYRQLQEIGNLINLEILQLQVCDDIINDIKPISNLANLKKFTLETHSGICNVSDLSPLQHLTNLNTLRIYSSKWIDQSPVHHVENVYIGTKGKNNNTKLEENLKEAILEKCDEASLDAYVAVRLAKEHQYYTYYNRIFDLCQLLRVTNLYDIGCGTMDSVFLLSRYPCIVYTGIECNEKHIDFINTYRCELFAEIYGERIKFQAGEYPFEITPPKNNVAISCFALGGGAGKDNEHFIKSAASSLTKNFERVIMNISHKNFEMWKSELAAFELYNIGESHTVFVFGTKFPEDIAKMKKKYKYFDNQFITGIGDDQV